VGYILSLLSWRNDLLVNIPLAAALATLVAFVVPELFVPTLVVGSWPTNVLGFVLLHVGGEAVITGEERPYERADLARDLLLPIGHTALVLVVVSLGWLSAPAELLS
jgi:hypothetical protein